MTGADLLAEWQGYWPYAVAFFTGAACAIVDRRVFGRYVLGLILVLIAAGGAIGMNASPFTFHGGDYYMESLIAMIAAFVALAGYVLSVVARCACACGCKKAETAP
ncbi:MAG: hypothetical protein ABL894_08625 [Hyphomicrobium sp.]